MNDAKRTKSALIKELALLRKKVKRLEGKKVKPFRVNDRQNKKYSSVSDKTFMTLADKAGDGILIGAMEGIHVYANKRAAEITGYSKSELTKTTIKDLVHPQELEKIMERFRKRLKGESVPKHYETIFVHKDGTSIPIEMTAAKTTWYGQPADIGVFRDISDRKQIESALRESEMRFATLAEASFEGIVISDQGRIVDCNEQLLTMMKCTRAEVIGHEASSFVAPESLPKVVEHIQSGSQEPYDHLALAKDGTKFPVEIHAKSLPYKGKPMRVTVIRDITQRKTAQEKLVKSLERLNIATKAANLGIWDWDILKNELMWDDQMYELYGIKRGDFKGAYEAWLAGIHPDDRKHSDVISEQARRGTREYDTEFRIIRPDGAVRILKAYGQVIRDSEGNAIRMTGVNYDITERKQVENVLLESAERYRSLFDNASIGIFHSVPEGRFLRVNPALARMLGYHSPQEMVHVITDIKTQIYVDSKRHPENLDKALNQDNWVYSENQYRRMDGTIVTANLAVRKVLNPDGSIAYLEGFVEDITDRKNAEEALRQSKERLSSFMNSASDSFYLLDSDLNFVEINKKGLEIIGKKKEDVIGKNIDDIVPDAKDSGRRDKHLEVIRTGKPFVIEDFIPHPIFGNMHFVLTSFKVGDGLGVIAHDITARKQAELFLVESEARLLAFMNYVPALVLIKDHELRPVFANDKYKEFFPADEWMGKKPHELFPPEIADTMVEKDTEALKKGYEAYEENWIDKHGKRHIFFTQKFRIKVPDKDPLLGAIISDITERKRIEEELIKNEALVKTAVENLPIIFYMINNEGIFELSIGAGLQGLGLQTNQVVGQSVYDVYKDHPEITESIDRSLAGLSGTFETIVSGSTYNNFLAPIPSLAGTSSGIVGVALDVTEQKKLQVELLQSQKMQSIGTLAGGIAHDFNNILGIILAYASSQERSLEDKNRILEYSRAITQAVKRGASLVRQILTFARQTDIVLAPMNLQDLIMELISMLEQTFPKVITFVRKLDPEILFINADRAQIYQSMLNLCVNARDAMSNGGTITIATERQVKIRVQEKFPDADHDAYVCIKVSDTGEGVDEAMRDRIFDPFFTTKEQGKGTGLGLAVVYGVVQSHHGFIDVVSEVGRGTTFRLFFPIPQTDEQPLDVPAVIESFNVGGTEAVLLVEDEKALLDMMQLLLEAKGYKVFTAQNGRAAVEIFKQHKEEIALVLTDLGLPEITGMDVFEKLKEVVPDVRVIFASGFFEPVVKSELSEAGAKGFVQKPYSPNEILQRFREVLDEKKE
jgi:two-component system, cell cycle sensor histidine kinase and response regulator CckA